MIFTLLIGFALGILFLYTFIWWSLGTIGPARFFLQLLNHKKMNKEARLYILETLCENFCFSCGAACGDDGDTTEEQHRVMCKQYASICTEEEASCQQH